MADRRPSYRPPLDVAGIYGMNFETRPELRVEWAYPVLLLSMVGVAAGMIWFFWRRGWLGERPGPGDEERGDDS